LGPASRRILAGMNPRQRRGILLLTLSALGLLGVFVLVAGYVADVRKEVDPKIEVLTLAKPAEKDKAISDDMVKTQELPRQWAPKTALRDRARLIGQVALADIPAGSVLQEGMLGSPPELATGEREIAILVDAETGVAGKLSPGSIVDIVATFGGNDQEGIPAESNVVVPGARIVDVGQPELKGGNGVQQQSQDPSQVVPVTFALDPREALTVTYAESFAAEVRLALLRPGEESELKKKERVYRRPGPTQQGSQ
jgi:pilus assembly protein CpaB